MSAQGWLEREACPYLGREEDASTHYVQVHADHRCYAASPPRSIEARHQAAFCFDRFHECPAYVNAAARTDAAWVEAAVPGTSATASGTEVGTAEASGEAMVWAPAPASIIQRLRHRLASLSAEEWTLFGVTSVLLAVIAYFALMAAPWGGQTSLPTPQARIRERALALLATATQTPTAPPTVTPRPTRAGLAPLETLPVPTAAPGGLVAALTPSERGVASYNAADKVPAFGDRSLNVGRFEGTEFIGGILFSLKRIPPASKLTYAAIELTGLSDERLGASGVWMLEMLDAEAADAWDKLTYATLKTASTRQTQVAWHIRPEEMATRRVNIFPFDERALAELANRLEQGKVAFRLRSAVGSADNVFAWDTGYGEGFGQRPVLRVAYVPPPPTPGPRPGEPTEVPLVIWVSEPTEAPATPSPTPYPDAEYRRLWGWVLFLSDRFGATSLMVCDPASGRVGQVTQPWPYVLARSREQSHGELQVQVQEVPCGSGATPVMGPGGRVLVPGDPARRCSQIVVLDTRSGERREVTEPGFIHYDPVFSPDGEWIAYVSQMTGGDEVFKVRHDGTNNQRLTDNVWEWDKHPSWSPDGSSIVFWSNREGRKQIYVMKADGSDQRPLCPSRFDDWDPVWVK